MVLRNPGSRALLLAPGQELTVRTGITHVLNLAQEARPCSSRIVDGNSASPRPVPWQRQVNIKEDISKPLGAKGLLNLAAPLIPNPQIIFDSDTQTLKSADYLQLAPFCEACDRVQRPARPGVRVQEATWPED